MFQPPAGCKHLMHRGVCLLFPLLFSVANTVLCFWQALRKSAEDGVLLNGVKGWPHSDSLCPFELNEGRTFAGCCWSLKQLGRFPWALQSRAALCQEMAACRLALQAKFRRRQHVLLKKRRVKETPRRNRGSQSISFLLSGPRLFSDAECLTLSDALTPVLGYGHIRTCTSDILFPNTVIRTQRPCCI